MIVASSNGSTIRLRNLIAPYAGKTSPLERSSLATSILRKSRVDQMGTDRGGEKIESEGADKVVTLKETGLEYL